MRARGFRVEDAWKDSFSTRKRDCGCRAPRYRDARVARALVCLKSHGVRVVSGLDFESDYYYIRVYDPDRFWPPDVRVLIV